MKTILKTNMEKENISLEYRIKNIDETRNYLLEEIKHNDLMSEKRKKVCRVLNYFKDFLICISPVSGATTTIQYLHLLH